MRSVEDTPAHFQHAFELCHLCRRLLPLTSRCRALEVLERPAEKPWAAFIAAPYTDDEDGSRLAKLVATLQADTDAAEGYRLGHTEHCDAFRPSTTSPADERSPRRTA